MALDVAPLGLFFCVIPEARGPRATNGVILIFARHGDLALQMGLSLLIK